MERMMAGVRKRYGSLLGPEGLRPAFTEGITEQVAANVPASLELVKTGTATYRVDAKIPKGLDGDPAAVANFGNAMAAELNTSGSAGQNALYGVVGRPVSLDVRNFGAFAEGSTWEVNRGAMQAANDHAATLPGGAVIELPRGSFQVKGVIQDSHVTFRGNGTTLVHPDGLAPGIITARVQQATGTIAAGSSTLTVDAAGGIEVGTVVAVRAAGGYSATQNTLLTSAITDTQTTGITLADTAGLPTSGTLVVGTEVIGYTSISAGVLSGVTRGQWGTTAAAHGTTGPADVIGMAAHHVAQVIDVDGTTVTLDRPAPMGVGPAPVIYGAVDPGVYSIRFYGNRDPVAGARTVYPVNWSTVGNGHGDSIVAEDCESAFFLGLGATGCELGTVTAINCGNPETGSGASFWMFQSCRRNKVKTLRIRKGMWSGLYWDDRTSTAEPFDGPCEDNSVDLVDIDLPVTTALNMMPLTTGVLAISSRNNVVKHLSARGVRTPIVFEAGGQWHNWNNVEPACTGNAVESFRARDIYQPWVIHSKGNTVVDAAFQGWLASGPLAAGSMVLLNAANGGAPAVRFDDGAQSAPSIRFGENITGFYRITASGEVQYVQGNVLGVRLTGSGIRFTDTGAVQTIQTGATNGTRLGASVSEKIAFYGKTPVAQPAAVADATDATSAVAQLNSLLAKLRTLGVIAT